MCRFSKLWWKCKVSNKEGRPAKWWLAELNESSDFCFGEYAGELECLIAPPATMLGTALNTLSIKLCKRHIREGLPRV